MSSTDVKGEVHLRPYQSAAIARIHARIAAGARRILVVAPCGAGKTVCFSRVIADVVARGQRALVVAHRRELIQQTFRKLCDAGLAEDQIGVLMASDPRRRPAAPVQVASIDTLRNRPKPLAHLVVRDEAHRALAKTDRDIAAAYPDAVHLGFTATPYRADNRGLGEAYDEIVVVASVQELIGQGFLVEPRVFTIPEREQPNLSGVRVRGGDYDNRDLDSAMDQQPLVGNIVEHWKRHAQGARTFAFAVSVKHSKHIAERFCESGIAAEHVDGATPLEERDAIFARLTTGETLVVSNVGIACEGTDIPPVKCAILARPTKSTGLYLQQAGRILRPWNDQRAIILDHAGCARLHGLPQDDRGFSLEPKPKRERDPTENGASVSIRVCTGCHAVLPGAARACPECGNVFAEAHDLPTEEEGTLVEATASQIPLFERPLSDHERSRRRGYFEQMRALARAKRRDIDWAIGRFAQRFGKSPEPEWIENAWGRL